MTNSFLFLLHCYMRIELSYISTYILVYVYGLVGVENTKMSGLELLV